MAALGGTNTGVIRTVEATTEASGEEKSKEVFTGTLVAAPGISKFKELTGLSSAGGEASDLAAAGAVEIMEDGVTGRGGFGVTERGCKSLELQERQKV